MSFSISLAATSTSMFTLSPGLRSPIVVTSQVWGMIAT